MHARPVNARTADDIRNTVRHRGLPPRPSDPACAADHARDRDGPDAAEEHEHLAQRVPCMRVVHDDIEPSASNRLHPPRHPPATGDPARREVRVDTERRRGRQRGERVRDIEATGQAHARDDGGLEQLGSRDHAQSLTDFLLIGAQEQVGQQRR